MTLARSRGIVDSHCHLDDSKFDDDREQVIERARAAGVERMMAIGTGNGPPDLEVAVRQGRALPVHLRHNRSASARCIQGNARNLARICANWPRIPKCWRSAKSGSITITISHRATCSERSSGSNWSLPPRPRKPIVIHTREAWDDTLAMLREHVARRRNHALLHGRCAAGAVKRSTSDFI